MVLLIIFASAYFKTGSDFVIIFGLFSFLLKKHYVTNLFIYLFIKMLN